MYFVMAIYEVHHSCSKALFSFASLAQGVPYRAFRRVEVDENRSV